MVAVELVNYLANQIVIHGASQISNHFGNQMIISGVDQIVILGWGPGADGKYIIEDQIIILGVDQILIFLC